VAEQVVSIFSGTNGFLDDLPVDQVRAFEDYLIEQFRSRYTTLLDEIRTAGTLPGALGDAVTNVKAGFTTGARAGGATANPLASDESAVPPATTDKTLETE
jgi:F-type H+-transporting ATPase subunit alpha